MRKLVLVLFSLLLLSACKKSYQEKFNIKEIEGSTEDVHIWEVKTQQGCDTVYSSDFYLGESRKAFYFYLGNNKNDVIAAYSADKVLRIKRIQMPVSKTIK